MQRLVFVLTFPVLLGANVVLLRHLPAYLGNVLFYLFLYSYLGQCWNILGGYGRQVSLGHSAFVGIGAYTYTLLVTRSEVSPLAAAAGGVLAGAILSAVFGAVIAAGRLRGIYFTLSSLAFAEVIRRLVNSCPILGGAIGLSLPFDSPVFGLDTVVGRSTLLLGALLLVTGALGPLRASVFGLRLRLIGLREPVAEATAVPVPMTLWLATTGSGCLSAFGGVLFSQHLGYVHPDLMFGVPLSVQCAVVTVLGGRGWLIGPLLGTAFLVPVSELSRALVVSGHAGVQLVVSGALIVAVVAFFPGGVAGAFSSSAAPPNKAPEPRH